jgi:hypothetical protein
MISASIAEFKLSISLLLQRIQWDSVRQVRLEIDRSVLDLAIDELPRESSNGLGIDPPGPGLPRLCQAITRAISRHPDDLDGAVHGCPAGFGLSAARAVNWKARSRR